MTKGSSKKAQVEKIVSPRLTLLAIKVGTTVRIPTALIPTPTIRVSATRLDKKKEARFAITTAGLINETEVTRIR